VANQAIVDRYSHTKLASLGAATQKVTASLLQRIGAQQAMLLTPPVGPVKRPA
jgi:hypothetical protein